MSPLKRHLRAGEGYLELGLFDLALDEINLIDSEHQTFPVVLRLRVEVCRALKHWQQMEEIARILGEGEPHESYGWINWAYAARRTRGLEAAKEILRCSLAQHPTEAAIHYNLACYECQLGRLAEARTHLDEAFRLQPKCRTTALTDPDLTPLHPGSQGGSKP